MAPAARDELQSVISHLHQQVGIRKPGSADEATAAAYLNARLRRAGAQVGTHAVTIPAHPQRSATVIFTLAVIAALLAPWLPLIGLLLAGWTAGALLVDQFIAPLPAPGRRLESQNVFGVRALAPDLNGVVRAPHWRVLLLARLDTPPAVTGVRRLLAPTRAGALARLLVPAWALAAALTALQAPTLAWLPAIGAAAYGMVVIGATLQPLTPATKPPEPPGAAVLVPTLAQLNHLRHVELWGVALGAVAHGDNTVATLLRNLPFDPATTLVIGIEELGGSQIVYATREGGLWRRPADDMLIRLADAADAADTTIDAEPRPFHSDAGLTAPFRRRTFRTITIASAPAEAATPAEARQTAEQAVRLLVGMIEQLDTECA